MKKTISIIVAIVIIILLSILFFLSRSKKTTQNSNPNQTSQDLGQETQLTENEKPIITLTPREDGHQLTLKITNIPSRFSSIDYELVYNAQDQGLEIQKGVSGTVKTNNQSISEDLLLGTASCTNGCKYKYDEGINGGILSLTLTTNDKQYVTFQTPFTLKNSTDINKDKSLTITDENFEIKGTVSSKKDFFIAIKNFKSAYSVFSNGTGAGKITSISPENITKTDKNSFIGDYIIP